MLDICRKFAEEYDVLFNSAKRKLLVFGRNTPVANGSFMDEIIEHVKYDKYLGNTIGYKCEAKTIDDAIRQFMARTNSVLSHFHHTCHDVRYKLFKTLCMPLYGAQLWDYGHKSTEQFYVTWRKGIRKIIRLPLMTHSDMLHYICNDIPLLDQLFAPVCVI